MLEVAVATRADEATLLAPTSTSRPGPSKSSPVPTDAWLPDETDCISRETMQFATAALTFVSSPAAIRPTFLLAQQQRRSSTFIVRQPTGGGGGAGVGGGKSREVGSCPKTNDEKHSLGPLTTCDIVNKQSGSANCKQQQNPKIKWLVSSFKLKTKTPFRCSGIFSGLVKKNDVLLSLLLFPAFPRLKSYPWIGSSSPFISLLAFHLDHFLVQARAVACC